MTKKIKQKELPKVRLEWLSGDTYVLQQGTATIHIEPNTIKKIAKLLKQTND